MHHIIYTKNKNYKINAHIHKIIHKIETHQAKIALLLFLVVEEDRVSGVGQGGRLDVL